MIKSQRYNRLKQIKVYILSVLLLAVIVLFYFISTRPSKHKVTKNEFNTVHKNVEPKRTKEVLFNGERIVHIDLKGAPPKISYYRYLFPLLLKLGATGVLMEYEDMFPYTGDLVNISAGNSYTREDINLINQLAEKQNLKVIPLIPTFGHFEMVLKLSQFQDFREIPEYPQIICPTYEKTEKLVLEIIKQVMSAHPNCDYIHLGADEVHFLGVCDRCNDFMLTNNLSKSQLFVTYINTIIKIIRKFFPNLKILIWDDQLRSFKKEDMKMDEFNQNLEPVIWNYSKDVYDDLGPSLWNNYRDVFKNVWIASAFKGASGSNEIMSSVTHYVQNHRSWMTLISEYQNQFNFQGIIITGWQRYDHFAVLCELLPVGIPTLAMCLRILQGYRDSPISPPKEVAKILKCEQPYALIGPVFGSPKCAFPGGKLLEQISRFQQLKQELEVITEDSRYKGWLSEYNVANCFSNTNYVESVTGSLPRIREDLIELKAALSTAIEEIYDSYTKEEWLDTYLRPLEMQVERLWRIRNKLLEQKVWRRRPFKETKCDL